MKNLKTIMLSAVLCIAGFGVTKAAPISDVSQLSNSKVYTITTARGAWTLNSAGTGIASSHKTNGTVEYDGADQTAEAKRFAIVKYEGFYYAYNLKFGGFLHYDGTGTKLSPLMGTPLDFVSSGDDSYPLRAATLAHDRYVNNNNGGTIAIDTWTYTDSGNKLDIEEVGDLTTDETTAMENALASSPMNPHKAFIIAANRGTWCANAAGTSLATTSTNTSPAEGYDQFAFVRFDKDLYIYNVGSKKFIKKDGSLKEGRGDAIYVRLSGDASKPYMFYFPDGAIYFNMQNGGGSYAMNTYNSPDDGNKQSLTIQNVDAFTAAQTEYNKTLEITYNLMYEGEQVGTTTVTEGVGAPATLPSSLDKGIFTYTYSPTYNQPGSTTITVTATPTFTISPDYVGATWYNMYIRQNDRWVGYNKGADAETPEPYKPYAATDEDKATKALQWAFVGNPFTTGIKVINREAGREKSLKKDGSDAVMRDGDTYWDIFGNNGGIVLREQETTNNYINQAGGSNGNFQFWNSSYAKTDGGSTMWLVEAPVTTTTVTYNVLYNRTIVKTTTATAIVDDPTPVTKLPAELLGEYVEVTGDDTHNVVADDVINLTAAWKGPFKLSASFNDAIWYYAKVRGSKYLRADENNKDDSGRYTTNTTNEQTDVYKWAFMGNPYSVQIINKGAGSGKYLYLNASSVPEMTTIDPATDNKACWIVAPSGSGFSVRNESGNTLYINDAGGKGNLGLWDSGSGSTDSGSCWTIEEVPLSVTYNLSFGGKVFSEVANQNALTAATVPASLKRDFVNYVYSPETLSPTTTEVNVTATWDGPFEISTSYASAHWYDMAMRGTWYVTSSVKDGDGAYKTQNANTMGLVEDSYQWAFIGNPFDGFKVINKEAGDGYSFGYTDEAQKNAGIPTVLADSEGTHVWKVGKSTSSIANSFTLNVPGTNLYINQFGGAGGSLKFWDSANNVSDAGSAFTIFDVPDDFAEYVVTDIAPYMENTAKYFNLTDAAKASIGYDASYKTSCTFAQYKTMKEALAAASADQSNFTFPGTGYYRVKSAYYNGYYMTYAENEGTPFINTEKNASEAVANVVKLTALGNNKYTITVGGLSATAPTESQKVGLAKTGAELTAVITTPGEGAFTTGETYGALHCANSKSYNVVGWTSDAAASQWILEDATINSISATISDAGYATFNALWPVTIPSGVTVYTATTDGTTLTLNKVIGTIPAATPVILEGNAGTYTFNFADDVAAIASNDLKGTYIDYTTTGGEYVLQKQNDKVGFYQVGTEDGDAKPVVRANRAYLTVPAGGATVKAFFFDGGEDAIKSVFDGVANGNIYDLSGRKVAKLQKGNTYIVNGKTVIVK